MPSYVYVLDCPAWHNQTILVFEICARGYTLDHLLCRPSIVRMYALEHHVQGWFLGAVVLEDPIRFIRPDNVSAVRFPPPAACVAELLGLRQISFASPDRFFCNPAFG